MNRLCRYIFVVGLIVVAACGPTKYVPDGAYLLNKVSIESDYDKGEERALKQYIRQVPNASTLGLWKIQLSTYSLSGRDSTKWFNRWLRRAGSPPVIYDSLQQTRSEQEIEKALHNKGYLLAKVSSEVVKKKKKADVTYKVSTSTPYRINAVHQQIEDSEFKTLLANDSLNFTLHKGMLLDRALLDKERQRITALLRNNGYYGFDAERINFTADSTVGNNRVDLTVNIKSPRDRVGDSTHVRRSRRYTINNVYISLESAAYTDSTVVLETDTTSFGKVHVVSTGVKWLDPHTLANSCFVMPDRSYSDRMVNNTYTSFNRFSAIKYFNLSFKEFVRNDSLLLDCYMQLSQATTTSVTAELMGTNTAGDFGFAASAGYQNRNSFKRGEIFNVKIRGAYENISGSSKSFLANNYYEIGGEASLSFPKFMFPFLSNEFKRRVRATSEVSVNYNLQKRPEYSRIYTGGTWSYKWTESSSKRRHTVDLLNINFVNVPYIDKEFLDTLRSNPLLWQSFESHLIVGMGYRFIKTNQEIGKFKRNTYSIRVGVESAGNLLYLISSAFNQKKDEGQYKMFGLPYSQYIRGDLDLVRSIHFSPRNSINFHGAVGMAFPYGNASVVPYEKLFYGGGANSVRGWSVRALGPGGYTPTYTNYDFANQLGDIRLDLSIEHRAKLFWKLESALFFDAGNIWNLKNYTIEDEDPAPDNESGVFKFSDFYKQIALAYGIGIRLNFDYFIVRMDWGFKLYDPAGAGRWVKPFSGRDNTLHFAIGYPF